MRIGNALLVLLISVVTQSCRIESTFFLNIIENHKDLGGNLHSIPFRFEKSVAFKMQGGFKDTLIIGESSISPHASIMRNIIHFEAGVPLKNIVFFQDFGAPHHDYGNTGLEKFVSDQWEKLRKATRVVHIAQRIPLRHQKDTPRIEASNTLFVLAAGNMSLNFRGDRDQYNAGHTLWHSLTELEENVIPNHNTGKVIVAKSARVDAGTVKPYTEVVQCGDVKESCFTMIPEQYTSDASARLSGVSFYLSQFWETPEEVVSVLKKCAVDIGEPGVDREYGSGLVNLWCPQVLKKEVEVVSRYLGKAGERGETPEGGELEGIWRTENATLQTYVPEALKKALSAKYQGVVNGTITFEEGNVTTDIVAKGEIRVVFLTLTPIIVRAEDTIQIVEEEYTTQANTLNIPSSSKSFTYTATEDSLHLIRSFTLNEILVLLPDPWKSMVDLTSPDFFEDDPIQIKMSFVKVAEVKQPQLVGDFDEDGMVGVSDFLLFSKAFGSSQGEPLFNDLFDLVPDGIINVADFLVFINHFGKTRDS